MLNLQPEKQDFQQMLLALQHAGFTHEALAKGLFLSTATINRILHGQSSPRYKTIVKIEDIFKKYCPVKADTAKE
jgi:transcriptional regulator with XRE-family HTH domain